MLAIKPQMLDAGAAAATPFVGPETLVVSILAGKRIADLSARLPASPAIAMPSVGPWISPAYTGRVGSPPTKQPHRSVPPLIDDRCTSAFIASYTHRKPSSLSGEPVLHTVRSAELWLFHRGSPLLLEIGPERESAPTVLLGSDIAAGESPAVSANVCVGAAIMAGTTAACSYNNSVYKGIRSNTNIRSSATAPTGTWVSGSDGRFAANTTSADVAAINLASVGPLPITPGAQLKIATTVKTSGMGGVGG